MDLNPYQLQFNTKFQITILSYLNVLVERVKINIKDWINELLSRGVGEIIFSCIEKDGTGLGFDENILNYFKT